MSNFKKGQTVSFKADCEGVGTVVKVSKNAFGYTILEVEVYEDGETFTIDVAAADASIEE